MIPTLSEAWRSLDGLWQLARDGAPAMRCFDRSPAGLLRSFGAAFLVAPFYALCVALAPPATGDWLRVALVEAIGYVIMWLAFPMALHPIAARLGRAAAWSDFVIALNWTGALVTAVNLPLTLIQVSAAVPGGLALLVSVVVFTASLAFEWYLARQVLRVGFAAAFGVVALDFALSLMIEGAMYVLLGGMPAA